jgi:hypothetical protein
MGTITGSLTKVSSTTTEIVFSYNLTTTATGLIFAQVVGDGQVFLVHDGPAEKPFIKETNTVTGLQPGTFYYFYWGAQDSDNDTKGGYEYFSTDNAPPPSNPPVWTDNTLAAFQAGAAYSDAVAATNSPSYSVTVGSLPTGISLNSTTGAVTGTPTTGGQSYSFTIRAINGDGNVTQAFSGTVAAAVGAGKARVWNGSVWVYGTVRVWNGSTWATGLVRVWNGSSWVQSY